MVHINQLYISKKITTFVIITILIMEQVKNYLLKHGIKPSVQRIKIYDYLFHQRTHPTVDTIYKDLNPEIPTLSKTTVYNTLKLFVDKGVAVMITIEDNEVRYDADTSIHGHFKCKSCGEVFDFQIKDEMANSIGLSEFKIEEQHVYLKGICKVCNNN